MKKPATPEDADEQQESLGAIPELMRRAIALGLTGFISGRDGAMPEQPPGVIFAIRMCVSVVPCLLAIAAAWFMRSYNLSGSRVES